MKKVTGFAVLLLAALLFLQSVNPSVAVAEEDPERYYDVPWTFLVYVAPDFRAETRGSFHPQTVQVIYRNPDGWAQIRTYNGNWWIYLRGNLRYVREVTPLFDRPGGTRVGSLAPQVVRILQQDGNWLQISTWLGPRWMQWRPPGTMPGEQPQPGQHPIAWQFITYLEPDFRAEKQETFAPQTVHIIEALEDGWARITTANGDRWVYLLANKRYIHRETTLHHSIGGHPGTRIEPQVVEVLHQEGNWLQIVTWLGPRWIQLQPERQPGERWIALTFDDGPGIHTERLLDALAERNVPVTFFVLGQQVAAFPDLARRIVAEGHEIASHAYHHRNLAAMGAAGVRTQLAWTNDIIYETTGVLPTLFRPPYGSHNGTVRSVAAEFGFPLILWSVDTRDWESRNVKAILSHFVDGNGIRIRNGDIILMHDIHSTTIDAAILAIDLLLADGFTFVTNSELLLERHGALIPGMVYSSAR